MALYILVIANALQVGFKF